MTFVYSVLILLFFWLTTFFLGISKSRNPREDFEQTLKDIYYGLKISRVPPKAPSENVCQLFAWVFGLLMFGVFAVAIAP